LILQESSLHIALKNYYSHEGDLQEVWVDGFLVDVLRGDLVIEIQTRNFSAIKPKLTALLNNHPVLLVYPIAKEKWITRQEGTERLSRRRSPRRGRIEDLFYELIRIPRLLQHPNLTLEVAFIEAEEIRLNDGKGSWRRQGWSIADRRLIEVMGHEQFNTPADFYRLLPEKLDYPFTIRDLAELAGLNQNLARKMAYCLREMDLLHVSGKRGRAQLFEIITPGQPQ
jgi:hypothetical protein